MVSRSVAVANALGVHARAAARFVHAASVFHARISVTRGARTVDGKSILGILTLAATQGTEITLRLDGEDETAACQAIVELIDGRFGEKE